MKFCFILTQDLQSPSGLGRYYPWAKELNKLGHDVEIIALHSNYLNLRDRIEYFSKNFLVHYVSQMHVKKIENNKTYFPFFQLIWVVFLATIRLLFFSLRSNADVYIIGKPHPMNGIAGVANRILLKKQMIIDCDDFESESNLFQNRILYKIIRYFEKKLPNAADFITTNTESTRKRLLESGTNEEKIKILPNGIDRDRFKNYESEEVEILKQELKIESKVVVGFIGSISLKSHPIDILIKACKEILQNFPDLIVMIVGGGEDFETLKDYSQREGMANHTLFVGRIPSEKISNYYRLCHVTVDPVKFNETAKNRLPLKMFESWACEVPFVTSDVGDRKFYLSNPIAGAVAKNDSAKELSKEILLVLQDKQFAKTIVENGKIKLKEFYWDRILEKFCEIMN